MVSPAAESTGAAEMWAPHHFHLSDLIELTGWQNLNSFQNLAVKEMGFSFLASTCESQAGNIPH